MMYRSLRFIPILLSLALLLISMPLVAGTNNMRVTEEQYTPLDAYVAAPDPAYRFELKETHEGKGWTGYVLHLISQTWLTPDKVDRTEWEHWLEIIVPDKPAHKSALLLIGGGSNG